MRQLLPQGKYLWYLLRQTLEIKSSKTNEENGSSTYTFQRSSSSICFGIC